MHQIKRDSEPHLGSGKCILRNLIRKEILMDYRPSPHLRHFHNDKSQLLLSLYLSLLCFSLYLFFSSFSSHESWLFNCESLEEHRCTATYQRSLINIHMHVKQPNSNLSVNIWIVQLKYACVYRYVCFAIATCTTTVSFRDLEWCFPARFCC